MDFVVEFVKIDCTSFTPMQAFLTRLRNIFDRVPEEYEDAFKKHVNMMMDAGRESELSEGSDDETDCHCRSDVDSEGESSQDIEMATVRRKPWVLAKLAAPETLEATSGGTTKQVPAGTTQAAPAPSTTAPAGPNNTPDAPLFHDDELVVETPSPDPSKRRSPARKPIVLDSTLVLDIIQSFGKAEMERLAQAAHDRLVGLEITVERSNKLVTETLTDERATSIVSAFYRDMLGNAQSSATRTITGPSPRTAHELVLSTLRGDMPKTVYGEAQPLAVFGSRDQANRALKSNAAH
ncbi:hypothetical protein B0T24DRAFT_592076 [Lasiosphaeria ovina]|uniref:Uncharacterized protein n=1 Tax=Lasiosphaeria ovina TaxID=92902 RepID=A0AAE0KH13_9PEZI|nr:hypothetical protein B0T24DRAFT_592076 [Lasiosphaeria ovina]